MSLNLESKTLKFGSNGYISFDAKVSAKHPLIKLMQALDWPSMIEFITPDLKKTAGKFWFLGRKLHVRIHLGAFLLQALFKMTDRATERSIAENFYYQVFCGHLPGEYFHVPDHTKIEEFRNRLSPETQQKLTIFLITQAKKLRFTFYDKMDLDSTVQEANITYPSDAHLLKVLAIKTNKVVSYLQNQKNTLFKGVSLAMGEIQKRAKAYYFRSKTACIEQTRSIFKEFYAYTKNQINPALQLIQNLHPRTIKKMPWFMQLHLSHCLKGIQYLKDLKYFIQNQTVKSGKILSFHAQEVMCITKGKLSKKYEFGRVFQLGRLYGNFMIPFTCTTLDMNDKEQLIPIIREYVGFFGESSLESINTDKGYYSKQNVRLPKKELQICTDGIQRPSHVKDQPRGFIVEERKRRRAGIEPLIGHLKTFGLGKSRMKSDTATLAAGYRSVLGFNLHQLVRHLTSKTAIV